MTGGYPGSASFSATLQLAKHKELHDGYVRVGRRTVQAPLLANAIDEHDNDDTVDMILALPSEDAAFYSSEEKVVELTGKSSILLAELVEQVWVCRR
jgi:hypothetical protein